MAAEYLWSGRIALRTFHDTLGEFYPHPGLPPRLTAGDNQPMSERTEQVIEALYADVRSAEHPGAGG